MSFFVQDIKPSMLIFNQEIQKPGLGNECVFIIRVHLMGLQNTLLPFLYLFETDPPYLMM